MMILQKIKRIDWILFALITIIACVGFTTLYSVTNGNIHPWASKQITRFMFGILIMFSIAIIDIKVWYKISWAFFFLSLYLLFFVEIWGTTNMIMS